MIIEFSNLLTPSLMSTAITPGAIFAVTENYGVVYTFGFDPAARPLRPAAPQFIPQFIYGFRIKTLKK